MTLLWQGITLPVVNGGRVETGPEPCSSGVIVMRQCSKFFGMVGIVGIAAVIYAADEPAPSVRTLPPVVVKTVPMSGDTAVDASKVTEIRVTFSKAMTDKSWSWSEISPDSKLPITGEIKYDADGKTCIAPVKLQAGKTYVSWLNSERFGNFKDKDGKSAVPYLLVFETKPAG